MSNIPPASHGPTSPTQGREPSRAPSRRPGREGGKRDTNRRERTDAILKAALTLFLERGLEAVTVDEIAKLAGTAKGNFYRYAEDKRDLVEKMLAPVRAGFSASFDKCSIALGKAKDAEQLTSAYLALAFELFAVVVANPEVVLFWLQESRAPGVGARLPITELERFIGEQTLALTMAAHAHGLLKKIPPQVSVLAAVGAVERLLIAYLRDNVFERPTEVVGQFVELILGGIRK
jgi:AcrR family transcriptional regulator